MVRFGVVAVLPKWRQNRPVIGAPLSPVVLPLPAIVRNDLICRIGTDRSLQIRQEIEQKCKVTSPGRRVHLRNAEQASADCDEQAINKRRSQSGVVSASAH
jgi:hypothetical protein